MTAHDFAAHTLADYARAMREFSWSAAEKKIARAAFDGAYERECLSIRREIESMLLNSGDSQVIWRLEDYLHKRRREIDTKYDYRYSVLVFVLTRLYSEGLLTDDDLAGLQDDKLQRIRQGLAF